MRNRYARNEGVESTESMKSSRHGEHNAYRAWKYWGRDEDWNTGWWGVWGRLAGRRVDVSSVAKVWGGQWVVRRR